MQFPETWHVTALYHCTGKKKTFQLSNSLRVCVEGGGGGVSVGMTDPTFLEEMLITLLFSFQLLNLPYGLNNWIQIFGHCSVCSAASYV